MLSVVPLPENPDCQIAWFSLIAPVSLDVWISAVNVHVLLEASHVPICVQSPPVGLGLKEPSYA